MIVYVASDGPDITARVASSRTAARYLIGYNTELGCFEVTGITHGAAGLRALSLESLAGVLPKDVNSSLSVAEVIDLVKQRELGGEVAPV